MVRGVRSAILWVAAGLLAAEALPGCSGFAGEWYVGIARPNLLLEYRDNAGVPAYCKSPEPLLAEMARAIGADSPEGSCVAQKVQDLSGASMVDIQCPVGEASGDCRDVYRALVWGERDPRSTTWFNLVSLGWVVRRCASEEEPYRASDAAVARAAGVSNRVNQFLHACQPDVVYIGQASAGRVVEGLGTAFLAARQ